MENKRSKGVLGYVGCLFNSNRKPTSVDKQAVKYARSYFPLHEL